MRLPDTIAELSSEGSQVFGEPYQTPDGATIIPVSTVRGRPGDSRVTAKPVGIFVVKDGKSTWTPAFDHTRVTLLGEVIGLVATTLATLAMVRRPPWPDVRADLSGRI